MPYFVDCPGCRQRLALNADPAGRRIKCRSCSTVIDVPAADPVPAVNLVPVAEEKRKPHRARRKPAPRPVRNPYRVPMLILLIGYFPFLTLLLVLAGGLAVWLLTWGAGHLRGTDNEPANLFALPALCLGGVIALSVLHTLWGLRALFWRPNEKDDLELELPDRWQEGLAGLVEEVADDGDLVTPDVIRLHAVDPAKIYLDRKGRSVLVIGGVAVAALSRRALAGVIAHELGHCSAGDIGLLRLAGHWHRVMVQLEEQFARRSWYRWNPLAWLVRGYHRLYLLLWFVNSRRQEYAADRHQVEVVGKDKAAAALVLVTLLHEMEFAELGAVAESCVETNQPMEEIFAEQVRRVRSAGPADWEHTLRRALRAPTHWCDTHPGLADRLKALGVSPKKALRGAIELMDPSGEPATALFANWPVVERHLTDRIMTIVRENYLARTEAEEIILAVSRAAERARQRG